jgi:hypothetical protein
LVVDINDVSRESLLCLETFDLVDVEIEKSERQNLTLLSPRILQSRHPIEHRPSACHVIHPIRHKVPKPLKLELLVGQGGSQ